MRLNDICAMYVSFLIKKSAIKIGLQAGFSGVSRSTHKVVTDCFTPTPSPPQKTRKNSIPTRHEFPINIQIHRVPASQKIAMQKVSVR